MRRACALLAARCRQLPAAGRRVRRRQGSVRQGALAAVRVRAVARRAAGRAPPRAHLDAPPGDQRLGHREARVREPPRAGLHAVAGVPDARAGGCGRLGGQRVLDRLRSAASQLDGPSWPTGNPALFGTPNGVRTAGSAGTVGWPEAVIRVGRDIKDGRFYDDVPWLLAATPTIVDPSRAPDGMHTLKLLSPQAWETPEGRDWSELKEEVAQRQLDHLRRFAPNLTDDKIVARYVKSPADIEASNPHMIHGAFHGGDRSYPFSGKLRPVPGWAAHRMPIEGLYQTGATTSVGGSITGIPGRNAAIVMLKDLGTSIEEVVAGAGRARAGSR